MYKSLYGAEAREKIMAGINGIVKAVAVTLGANGRNVVLSKVVNYNAGSLPNQVTKDGVTVARAYNTDDEAERVGVMAVKEAAAKTVLAAGDGTTSTCVLLRAIAEEGMKKIEAGANPIHLKKKIDKAVAYVVGELDKIAVPVKGDMKRIRQVATVSANNDTEIGNLIADAYEAVGESGAVDLVPSNGVKTELKIAKGFKIDRSFVHPQFVENQAKWTTEIENPLILLYEKRINHHNAVTSAIQIAIQQRRPLLIICEDLTDEGLAFILMNKNAVVAVQNEKGQQEQVQLKLCAINSPEFGEERRLAMEDIALMTGGMYMSDTKGTKLENITLNHFGQAEKVIINKDETIILGGAGKAELVSNRVDELKDRLKEVTNDEEKEPIERRIAKLSGGVAVINVGGATETEMRERLDRFDDAVRAVKSAFAEGIVPGGGTAFLHIAYGMEAQHRDEGFMIVWNALAEPLRQIISNSGDDIAEVISKIVGNKDANFGYNALIGEVENLLDAGIVDPKKVLRCSLENAASAAGMVLTAECVLIDSTN